ncbi:hypothetical protein BDV32DRAFT_103947 [Aspergillus pseudonomiae]|nr:hypothetical protein BDV32DRAFT_103947 [Aspergillus pseudonomiae]
MLLMYPSYIAYFGKIEVLKRIKLNCYGYQGSQLMSRLPSVTQSRDDISNDCHPRILSLPNLWHSLIRYTLGKFDLPTLPRRLSTNRTALPSSFSRLAFAIFPLPSPPPAFSFPVPFFSLSIFDSLLPLIVSIGVGSRGVLFWLADGIDLFLYIRDLLSRPHLLSHCCAILSLSCYSLELDSADTSVTTKALVLTDHGVIWSNVMRIVIICRTLQLLIATSVSLERRMWMLPNRDLRSVQCFDLL